MLLLLSFRFALADGFLGVFLLLADRDADTGRLASNFPEILAGVPNCGLFLLSEGVFNDVDLFVVVEVNRLVSLAGGLVAGGASACGNHCEYDDDDDDDDDVIWL
jgi:hypothetical protein